MSTLFAVFLFLFYGFILQILFKEVHGKIFSLDVSLDAVLFYGILFG
ncbi:MAG: hypothetical protein J7L38_07025 [Thermoproteales archaeon]|nr:hypothetical protein [Thermoproteales archaeon]